VYIYIIIQYIFILYYYFIWGGGGVVHMASCRGPHVCLSFLSFCAVKSFNADEELEGGGASHGGRGLANTLTSLDEPARINSVLLLLLFILRGPGTDKQDAVLSDRKSPPPSRLHPRALDHHVRSSAPLQVAVSSQEEARSVRVTRTRVCVSTSELKHGYNGYFIIC